MSKLVVVTDLGTFKALRIEEDRLSSSPRFESVLELENPLGDDRISRRLSDQAGQHSKGSVGFASINDGENGERHNMWLENRKRSVKEIAAKMDELLGNGDYETCYFAAKEEINNAILEQLSPAARGKIQRNIPKDLVNAKRDELIEQFRI